MVRVFGFGGCTSTRVKVRNSGEYCRQCYKNHTGFDEDGNKLNKGQKKKKKKKKKKKQQIIFGMWVIFAANL